ncbi:uncharacterized protein [Dysidea avara]|uniref:uncharacterized protein isoform X2 n=1 Tax=Dysidea avara TaxID=196820 RepID=UPI003323E3D5
MRSKQVCLACPEMPQFTVPRTNGSCQPFPSEDLYCSRFIDQSNNVYIHNNIDYTLLNQRLFQWRSNGSLGSIRFESLFRPASYCSIQLPYMACVYLYPPCIDGVPVAFCENECSDAISKCCEELLVDNLMSLIAHDPVRNSPLNVLCDYDDVNTAGNLYPYNAGEDQCYPVRSVPRIPENLRDFERLGSELEQLNITNIDHIVYGNRIDDPCIFEYGKSYVLACTAIGEPSPQVMWYNDFTRGIIPLTGYDQYYLDNNRTSIIVIENFTDDDMNIYHCNATNDLGYAIGLVEIDDVMSACCNDSAGVLRRKGSPFNVENCTRCLFFDTLSTCELSCEPTCPPIPNNCVEMEPTSDGCCMSCTSYGTANGGSSTGVTVAITVVAVIAGLALVIITVLLVYRQTRGRSRSHRTVKINELASLSLTVNVNYEGKANIYNTVCAVNSPLKNAAALSPKFDELLSKLSEVEIPAEALSLGKELGEGAFGTVYRGTITDGDTSNTIDVAVKTIKADVLDSDEVVSFLAECVLMNKLQHPNVLGLLGVCLETENGLPYIVLPFMINGDLKSYLRGKRNDDAPVVNYPKGLDYGTLLKFCCETARGMEYLAEHQFVHRDLAARNCLVSSDLTVKIGDFGLARQLYSKDYYKLTHKAKVPIKWMAIESIHDGVFNEKTDVWAFGITCWEVFMLGGEPYAALEFTDMLKYLEQGSRLKRPKLCSQAVYEVMQKCWLPTPNKRPAFSAIVLELSDLTSNQYVNIDNNNTNTPE